MIPVNRPTIPPTAYQNVGKCFYDGWVAQGDFVNQFETSWARKCNREYAIAVSSGTAALQLAVKALDMVPQSEIIMPSFTIISCANAALHNNMVPVFVDCDPDTWCIDPTEIERAITPNTRAIMVVHMFGQPCDMDSITIIAMKHNLYIIEDAAQAHCSSYRGIPCGSFGHVSCFSFYANKLITTGEGGMVLTNDARMASHIKSHSSLCFGHAVNRFNHIGIGHNFRLSNIQAALGCAQIPLVDSILERKREINRRYRSNLDGCSGLQWQGSYPDTISNSWANGFLLTNGIEASNVIVGLQANGVESRPFFYPMHKQKFVKDRCEYLSCQFSSHLAEYGMYLPSGVGTTDDEIDVACDTLCRILDT